MEAGRRLQPLRPTARGRPMVECMPTNKQVKQNNFDEGTLNCNLKYELLVTDGLNFSALRQLFAIHRFCRLICLRLLARSMTLTKKHVEVVRKGNKPYFFKQNICFH